MCAAGMARAAAHDESGRQRWDTNMNLRRELHYQYRCARLGLGFLTGRFIHCNLQLTYRCNFKCQICDFWKTQHDPAEELSLEDIRLIGEKLNRLGTLIISL